jgi:hypothetical protein
MRRYELLSKRLIGVELRKSVRPEFQQPSFADLNTIRAAPWRHRIRSSPYDSQARRDATVLPRPGFSAPAPDDWRAEKIPFFSIQFGANKINVHAPDLWQNRAFTLRGHTAQPGCGDFCFVWSGTLRDLTETLQRAAATIEEGPVERIGARDAGHAKGISIYTRDPDNNLLEFIVYEPAT